MPRTAASAVSTGQWLQWMGQTVVTQQLRPPSASPTNVTAMPGVTTSVRIHLVHVLSMVCAIISIAVCML